MENKTFGDAKRIQESFLSPMEKSVLLWFASRMPSWVKPDHLTSLGLITMLLAGVSYAFTEWSLIFFLFVNIFIFINWFGDSLDGTLARFRNTLRPRYGFYVDHIADMFGALFLVTGLIISNYISMLPAVISLIVFFMLSINSYLITYVYGVFKLSFWKLGPTELRLVLIGCNFFVFLKPTITIFNKEILFFDLMGYALSIVMGIVLVFLVIQNTILLYKEERI